MGRLQSSPISSTSIIAGLGVMSVGLVWYVALMRGVWAASALSPICGHSGLLVAHCPPCYAALSLLAGGLMMAATGLAAAGRGPVQADGLRLSAAARWTLRR